MLELRKTLILTEVAERDALGRPHAPITRAVGMAVIRNPYAGLDVEDLSALFDTGGALGDDLMARLVPVLGGPAVSYGKGALVGVAGEIEHGGAMIHPRLGKAMRAPLGGGAALIPSNAKVGGVGAPFDLPLGHKDQAWSFDHFDTITVSVGDAPRPDEIIMIVGIADGGRAHPRVGQGPLTD